MKIPERQKLDKKEMLKSLAGRGKYNIKTTPPAQYAKFTTQDSVPIYAIHEEENLIETYPQMFTKTYQITENNYQTETEENQQAMFVNLRNLFNSLDDRVEMSITIFNKDINIATYRDNVLLKEMGDGLDHLRNEMNKIILDRIKKGRNGLEKGKYLTVGVHVADVETAHDMFTKRLDNLVDVSLKKIQSGATVLPLEKRLELLHDIYNISSQGDFLTYARVTDSEGNTKVVPSFELSNVRSMGLTISDVIGPSSVQVFDDYMMFGNRFARVMRVTNYPNSLSDSFAVTLTDQPFNMITTVNIQPIPNYKSTEIVNKNLMLAKTQKHEALQNSRKTDMFADESTLDPTLQEEIEKAEEIREDMVKNDEKLFKTTHTLVVWAETKEQLDEYTDVIVSACQGNSVEIKPMVKLQEMGFNTTLPLLDVEIPMYMRRTLKSTSVTCVSNPFSYMELNDVGGINYSMNLVSKALIVYNRLNTQNFNGFILGTPGCFTGDTEVMYVEDEYVDSPDFKDHIQKKTMKAMMESGKPTYNLVACNPVTGQFIISKGRHIRKVKDVYDLAVVHLSNKEVIRCTLDHLWMTNDGTYVQAQDLEAGTKMKSLCGEITVTKVEFQENLPMPVPVYDLQSDNIDDDMDFENYTLGCGVVVHNSGKSFAAKTEMLNVVLSSNAKCIVIDPESEYGSLAKMIGGEVIPIMPGGRWHINPMEIKVTGALTGEDSNPVLAKSDFVLKLMEIMVKSPFGLTSIQETIIDECVHALYKPFMKDGILQPIPKDQMPTLTDLQVAIGKREEPEARELAMALKLYTGDGSLNTFGFRSNVDVDNRFVVYDIKDIGDKLKPLAMLIILDSIQTELFNNRKAGRNTFFWVDECYLLFQDDRTANFLNMLFKRARKYGGVPTGITQNVEDLLENDVARKMLSNCNFLEILTQAPSDREKLRELLNLSDSQVNAITSAPRGQGIIYTGTNCVAFYSQFPKSSPIYRVLTSNMAEIKAFQEEEMRKTKKEEK